MAIGHDKRDLLRSVPRDKTKLRNKNYNATQNPRNEICTVLWPVRVHRYLLLLVPVQKSDCFIKSLKSAVINLNSLSKSFVSSELI